MINYKGKWWMFLMVNHKDHNQYTKLAVSEDGINWQRPNLAPILEAELPWEGNYVLTKVAKVMGDEVWLYYFGKEAKTISRLRLRKPKIVKNTLHGEIIYIDRFGNLITNIDRKTFIAFVGNKKFEIKLKGKKINGVSESYQGNKKGEILAVFDSFDNLEIAVSGENLAEKKNIETGLKVTVEKLRSKD